MSYDKTNNKVFKPYLLQKGGYKGGKTLSEVKGKQKIYKLSSNENPVGTSQMVQKAISKELENLHLYPERTNTALRSALSDFYNNELEADQFLVTNSGLEILDMIIRAFLREGNEVIMSNPCFKPYSMFSNWQGAKIIDVPLELPEYSLNVDKILASINEKTRLIFLTSPNNPTGSYIRRKDLDRLINSIPAHVFIILDEVYWHFAEASDYSTAIDWVKEKKNIFAVNSFSKTFGLAGLRIGYGYTSPELASYVRNLSRPFLINRIGAAAIKAILKDQTFLEETIRIVKEGRAFIQTELERLGIKFWPSQANFILLDPQIDAYKFEDLMLQEGVMVRPVENFGAPGKVRVSIGNEEANKAFIKAIEHVLIQS